MNLGIEQQGELYLKDEGIIQYHRVIDISKKNDLNGAKKLLGEIGIQSSFHPFMDDARIKLINIVGTREEKVIFLNSLYDCGKRETAIRLGYDWKIEEIFEKNYSNLTNPDVFESQFNLIERVLSEKLAEFSQKHDVKQPRNYICFLNKFLTLASCLSDNYDVGIPLTNGGIYVGFVFNLFGLPLVPARTKRIGMGAEFEWLDSPKDLDNKRILIMDDDIQTGKTLKKVEREIKKYNPKQIDLVFVDDGGWSNFHNIPRGFKNVYHSGIFEDGADCLKIYKVLKRIGYNKFE